MMVMAEEALLRDEALQLDGDLSELQDAVERELSSLSSASSLTSSSSSIRGLELASNEINGKISRMRVLLRELQTLSEEAEAEDVFKELCVAVSKQKRRLEENRARAKETFTKAGERLKRNVARDERDQLLGRNRGLPRERERDELQAAEKVTSSLQKTRQMLARQLDHTESTLGIMDESHATLSKVNETYGEHTGLLNTGKRLLTAMENQERRERFLLYVCFGLFLLVVAYIVAKRFAFFAPVHKLLPARRHKIAETQEEIQELIPPPDADQYELSDEDVLNGSSRLDPDDLAGDEIAAADEKTEL